MPGSPSSGMNSNLNSSLRQRAQAWIDQDPDDETRRELKEVLRSGDEADLSDRFSGPLEFGTAGLRGILGAGPNRMNRIVVAQAAAGLAAWLHAIVDNPSVVIGHDARHKSRVFAVDSAQILQGAGVQAFLLPHCTPTPVTAFAINHLQCSAGIMVTASHNPPQDNGYKVYLCDSSQIVPPIDAQISEQIAAIGPIDVLPRSDDYINLGDEIEKAYCQRVIARSNSGPRDIKVVYTAMHGVGWDTFKTVAAASGFTEIHPVTAQATPDPDFPTVKFPNPEEPGAMDLALELASQTDADVIIANDPDADRCAVGLRHDGAYHMLSGDQVGALLGEKLLASGVAGTYAASIVSSDLLAKQSAHYGQSWQQTLTGFKWLGKIPDLVFGFEEALGYSVAPDIARDKDGISAGLAVLEMAAELKADGRTMIDLLGDISMRHGWHETGQVSLRVPDLRQITRAMESLRSSPPRELAGLDVTAVHDFSAGFDEFPATDMIRLVLGPDARIICRPSGTEPKLKAYVQVVTTATGGLQHAQLTAKDTIGRLQAAFRSYLQID